jgi:superfamily II RNA helicase
MVMWSEGEGKRGSCKVGIGILKVINLLKERKILPVKELIFWTGGCCGQNKKFNCLLIVLHRAARFR